MRGAFRYGQVLHFCFIAVLFVFIRRAALNHTLRPSLGYSKTANIIKKDLNLSGDIFGQATKSPVKHFFFYYYFLFRNGWRNYTTLSDIKKKPQKKERENIWIANERMHTQHTREHLLAGGCSCGDPLKVYTSSLSYLKCCFFLVDFFIYFKSYSHMNLFDIIFSFWVIAALILACIAFHQHRFDCDKVESKTRE